MKKRLIIKNEVSEISRLATFVEEIGEEFELELKLVMNLNLILEEAVSNIIFYAYPREKSEKIIIDVVKNGGNLVFTITDNGVEFDPTKTTEADITLPAGERPIGGLGIFLIKKIMNEVTYQRIDGANIFTLKKEL